MNETLKAQHEEQLVDPATQSLYQVLCEQLEKKFGEVPESSQLLVYDIALAEQIKRRLLQDIAKRGAVDTFRNGRQTVMRENKSVIQTQRLMEQQRKNLVDLGLVGTKRRGKAAGDEDPEDDGDDFDRFE